MQLDYFRRISPELSIAMVEKRCYAAKPCWQLPQNCQKTQGSLPALLPANHRVVADDVQPESGPPDLLQGSQSHRPPRRFLAGTDGRIGDDGTGTQLRRLSQDMGGPKSLGYPQIIWVCLKIVYP